MNTDGRKYDKGKDRWRLLLPWEAVRAALLAPPAEPRDLVLLTTEYALGDRSAMPRIAGGLLHPEPEMLSAAVKVLEYGAQKYDVDNWQRVKNPRTRYFDALCRHLSEDGLDPESRLPHQAHAFCCALFLIWFDMQEEKANEPSQKSTR